MDKDNTSKMTEAFTKLTQSMTELAVGFKYMSEDITKIQKTIDSMSTSALSRAEFTTFLNTQFKAHEDDIKSIKGDIGKVVGFVILAVIAAVLGLVLIPHR